MRQRQAISGTNNTRFLTTPFLTKPASTTGFPTTVLLAAVVLISLIGTACRAVDIDAATGEDPASSATPVGPTPSEVASSIATAPTPSPLEAEPRPNTANSIDEVDFRNGFVYDLGRFGSVEVADGGFVGDRESHEYVVFAVDDVQLGDLDGDGESEAAVTTRHGFGGTGSFSMVRVFALRDNVVAQVGTTPAGDRGLGGVIAARISGAQLLVERHSDDGGTCCPTHAVQDRYELAEDALMGVGEELKRSWISAAATDGAIEDVTEIKFLPGTTSGLIPIYPQFGGAVRSANYSFDAGGGQRLVVDKIRGVGSGGDIELRVAATTELIAVGERLDVFLPATGAYRLTTTSDPGDQVILEISITGATVLVDDPAEPDLGSEPEDGDDDSSESVAGEPTWETEEAVVTFGEEAVAMSTLRWPVLTATSARGDLELTNNNIAAYVAALDDPWTDDFVASKGEPGGESVFELDYEVTLAAPELLSIRFDFYQYSCCRPYPSLGHRAIVVDLNTGNVLGLGQYLNDARLDELGLKLIEALIVDYALEPESSDYVRDGLEYMSWDAVALRPDGIEIGTDRGELLANAYPPTITILTWSQLGDIVWPGVVSDAVIGRTESTAMPGLDG